MLHDVVAIRVKRYYLNVYYKTDITQHDYFQFKF